MAEKNFKFCTACGRKVALNAKFCAGCGAALGAKETGVTPKRKASDKKAIDKPKVNDAPNPSCAGCGISPEEKYQQFKAFYDQWGFCGTGSGESVLQYCNNCRKYFCGSCALDLGYEGGCPECKKALESVSSLPSSDVLLEEDRIRKTAKK